MCLCQNFPKNYEDFCFAVWEDFITMPWKYNYMVRVFLIGFLKENHE